MIKIKLFRTFCKGPLKTANLLICLVAVCFSNAQVFTKLNNLNITEEEDNSWSVNFIDYNNDGYEDLFISNYDEGVVNLLFENTQKNSFKHIDKDVFHNNSGTVTSSWADCNNDGLEDMLLANQNELGNTILINDCFTEFYTKNNQSLALSTKVAHGISWADYNNDGFLDVFICSYLEEDKNELYKNIGNCQFEKVELNVLDEIKTVSIGAVWCDVNNDGWQDLFIPSTKDNNFLLINDKNGDFAEVNFQDNMHSVGVAFADIDNDLDFDLIVSNASDEDNALYLNVDGNFIYKSESILSNNKGNSHGVSFGDYNNDGWVDLIVANDRGDKNFLYWNDKTGNYFLDNSDEITLSTSNSFGIANADFDQDGDLDVYVTNHSNSKNEFYRNDLNTSKNWIKFKLSGVVANKSAIGSKISIFYTDSGIMQQQIRMVQSQTSGGPGSQNSLIQHFGLGNASQIDSMVVQWSGYNCNQFFSSIASNKMYEIVEGQNLKVFQNRNPYEVCKSEDELSCRILYFPNPVGDAMFFQKELGNKITKIELFDINGKKYLEKSFSGDADLSFINTRPLSSNLYIAKVTSNCGERTLKFIKQ